MTCDTTGVSHKYSNEKLIIINMIKLTKLMFLNVCFLFKVYLKKLLSLLVF